MFPHVYSTMKLSSSLRLILRNGAFPKLLSRGGDIVATSIRPISITATRSLREIKINESDDKIVVEGVPIESDRKPYLIELPSDQRQTSSITDHQTTCTTCPLCRLNLRRLSYSDVLILQQFIESDGKLIARELTGLCHRSYAQVRQLVKRSQKARLLPRPPSYESGGSWDDLNRYYEYPRRIRDQPMRIIRKEFWNDANR